MGEGKKLTDNLVLKTLKTHVLNMIQLALKVLKEKKFPPCLKRGTWLIYVINIKSPKNKKPHYGHSLKYKITNDQMI